MRLTLRDTLTPPREHGVRWAEVERLGMAVGLMVALLVLVLCAVAP